MDDDKSRSQPKFCGIHVLSNQNLGDLVCSPLSWFKFPNSSRVDLYSPNLSFSPDSVYIVGGGGLFWGSPYVDQVFDRMRPLKTVFWGAGTNLPIRGRYNGQYPANSIGLFKMVGVRDYGTGFRYVPCASCMSPLFEKYRKVKPEREFVFYSNVKRPVEVPANIPRAGNLPREAKEFEDVVRFLASAETVISTSYHGIYWATLLGKKVVYPNEVPFSDKFLYFKYPPIFSSDVGEWDKATSYEGVLEESRGLNEDFFQDVVAVDW